MKKLLFTIIASSILTLGMAQTNKRALEHSDYDGWKDLKNHKISNDGDWVCYEINPQKEMGSFIFIKDQQQNLILSLEAMQLNFLPTQKV